MARSHRGSAEVPTACPAAWLWLLAGIFIGIFMSFLFYLKQLAPLPPPVASTPPAPPLEAAVATKNVAAEDRLELPPQEQTKPEPPPRFEFYDMLPKSQITPPPSRPLAEQELAQIQAADMPAAPLVGSQPAPMRPEDFPVAGQPYPPALAATPAATILPATGSFMLPATGHFMLQVASFRDLQSASELQTQLNQQGFAADIQQALVNGVQWYRVRTGPYATPAQAAEIQNNLQQKGYRPLVQKF